MKPRSTFTTSCNHSTHADCMKKWLLKGTPTCPMCRKALSPEEIEHLLPLAARSNPKTFVMNLQSAIDLAYLQLIDHDTAVESLRHLIAQGVTTDMTSLLGNIMYTVTLLN
jgi:hypothetical protein